MTLDLFAGGIDWASGEQVEVCLRGDLAFRPLADLLEEAGL